MHEEEGICSTEIARIGEHATALTVKLAERVKWNQASTDTALTIHPRGASYIRTHQVPHVHRYRFWPVASEQVVDQDSHVADVYLTVVIRIGSFHVHSGSIATEQVIDQDSHIGNVDFTIVVHVTAGKFYGEIGLGDMVELFPDIGLTVSRGTAVRDVQPDIAVVARDKGLIVLRRVRIHMGQTRGWRRGFDVKCRQGRHVIEGIVAQLGERSWQINKRQRGAAVEGAVANGRHSVGHSHLGQRRAVKESRMLYPPKALGHDDSRQCRCATECLVIDDLRTIGHGIDCTMTIGKGH